MSECKSDGTHGPVEDLLRLLKEAGLTPTLCPCAPNHATPGAPCPCDKCHEPLLPRVMTPDEARATHSR
jgi:hypothetical protein